MRRRILFGALLAALVAVLAIAGTAVAGQPIAGCTDSFSLVKAKVNPVVDKNGDGWICEKPLNAGFNDIDNGSNH